MHSPARECDELGIKVAHICKKVCVLQFKVAGDIIKTDGFGSLYNGLSAGLLRQATYTTARLGIFNNISEKLKEVNEGKVGSPNIACLVSGRAALDLTFFVHIADYG